MHSHSARGTERREKKGRKRGEKRGLQESRQQVTEANIVAKLQSSLDKFGRHIAEPLKDTSCQFQDK